MRTTAFLSALFAAIVALTGLAGANGNRPDTAGTVFVTERALGSVTAFDGATGRPIWTLADRPDADRSHQAPEERRKSTRLTRGRTSVRLQPYGGRQSSRRPDGSHGRPSGWRAPTADAST